ncbi:deoxyribose-phosphate aldolase [Malacoplasma penetrans]|uniref:Deoxyribose-phosphate aldolase n=1 Tax=Malacoplasma penetrans (strain HF-2) TaxID=272633 RepID=DEOC_MALP2|nr:deoxyribose-phosphate aldolase [Malacoplasma penetrans]Q8EWT4.1 RecName: Full=Deoxyribose-phosphate aldolase; Short=DERA; AltName: Full=2-deoxy-D-ribose 5-phosphate aldolase; AltName: Full=Phosphodeoxyriboaldolase; Short=Deoxyriboaldolase [Malacoplasma penetrans HF-2]RXY97308.1 deoxyribose-phosphate aldolase [Malacoplasma penetrans]BAC43909.1 deoxyribose-phosphate aldolase [Malacoplasma penetrans HF-2]
MEIDIKKIANMFDHTRLAPDATLAEIEKLCNEAKQYGFFSVCVNPYFIEAAKKFLSGSNVLVCTVIGFPLGQNTIETKVFETKDCVAKGAHEIDMVINISKLKEGDVDYCVNEINEIKKACNGALLKVIVETCLLTPKEKELAAQIVLKSNADYIKTSTGFSTAGATFEDIEIFKKVVGNNKLIKAAGGIKTTDDLLKMISLGANRIGTSRGVELIEGLKNK